MLGLSSVGCGAHAELLGPLEAAAATQQPALPCAEAVVDAVDRVKRPGGAAKSYVTVELWREVLPRSVAPSILAGIGSRTRLAAGRNREPCRSGVASRPPSEPQMLVMEVGVRCPRVSCAAS
jgi:hypothetical protein